MADLNREADRTLEILCRVTGFDRAALRPDLHLVADVGVDSIRAMELILELEEAFGVEIAPEEAAGFETVGDLIRAAETWSRS